MTTIHANNQEFKSAIQNAALEKTTKDTYINHLNMWLKFHPSLADIINQPETFVPLIDNGGLSESSKAAMHKAIIALLKHSGHKESHPDVYSKWYNDYFQKSNAAMKQKWNDFVQAPKTLEGAMTWRQIIDKYNETSRNKPYSLEHLTIAMYTIIPPRRQRDYWKTALIS